MGDHPQSFSQLYSWRQGLSGKGERPAVASLTSQLALGIIPVPAFQGCELQVGHHPDPAFMWVLGAQTPVSLLVPLAL